MSDISAEVLGVIVAMVAGEPYVLTLGDPPRVPAGPLRADHRSMQAATRAWVEQQTGRELGYLEQLYTFAGVDRASTPGMHLSISYLGLTARSAASGDGLGSWRRWYEVMPWEDQRSGTVDLAASLTAWADADPDNAASRRQRCSVTFGLNGYAWQPEWALQRYELLYEAGLVPESPEAWRRPDDELAAGERMLGDHRRVLATGVARLRAKIQYRPVVFELLDDEFTLRELQSCVEALAGRRIHTQNFRRLINQQDLVEETPRFADTGGRPARLFRFRRAVLTQRQVAGTKLPLGRVR
ncbi:MAG: NUDIX hydrolase [Propioniciclava sp.]